MNPHLPTLIRARRNMNGIAGLPPDETWSRSQGGESVYRGVGGVRRWQDGDIEDHAEVSHAVVLLAVVVTVLSRLSALGCVPTT